MDFATASGVSRVEVGRFVGEVPDGWQQGRGAFGGMVLAMLLRAIERSEPDAGRTTRALTGDLCGPVLPGPIEIVVEALRRGNNLSNFDARLIQGAEVQARASAVLSVPRPQVRAPAPSPPSVADWRELSDLGVGPPIAPVFCAHFEYRSLSATPFAATGEPSIQGFLRLRAPPPRLDAPTIMALLDAW